MLTVESETHEDQRSRVPGFALFILLMIILLSLGLRVAQTCYSASHSKKTLLCGHRDNTKALFRTTTHECRRLRMLHSVNSWADYLFSELRQENLQSAQDMLGKTLDGYWDHLPTEDVVTIRVVGTWKDDRSKKLMFLSEYGVKVVVSASGRFYLVTDDKSIAATGTLPLWKRYRGTEY